VDTSSRCFVVVTNIPTPYRLHFFRALAAALGRRSWRLVVCFMAHSESGRYWDLKAETFGFEARFFAGIHPRILGATLHVNPGIPLFAWRVKPRVVLVAGGWALPTNVLMSLGLRARRNSTVVFWSESHLASRRSVAAATELMRMSLLRLYDAFAVPGRLASEYVTRYAPGRPILELPNVVDERAFSDGVAGYRADRDGIRRTLNVDSARRVLLTLARLIPEKGLIEFVRSVGALPKHVASRFTLLIGGEGPLRSELEVLLRSQPQIDVRLLGHVAESDVVRLLAVADGFVLPSLSEPNPLSAVEALWAGVPLLLSDRVGNHPDLLQTGVNGWTFDVSNPSAIRTVVTEWAQADSSALARLGRASHLRAAAAFCTETIVDKFLDNVLGVS